MKSGLEIAQEAVLRPIAEIADAAGPGARRDGAVRRYRAKVSLRSRAAGRPPDGKLIITTAITPTKAGEGKTTTSVVADAGARQDRQERHAVPARALHGAGVRHQGRRQRRRLRPGRADGGDQPALQRRLPRRDRRAQPAGGRAGRLDLQRQPAGDRPADDHLAAHPGHERPRAPLHGRRPRRQGARHPARERVRDHGRLRDHGGVRARRATCRTCAARLGRIVVASTYDGEPVTAEQLQRRRRDDGDHEGRASSRTSCRRSRASRCSSTPGRSATSRTRTTRSSRTASRSSSPTTSSPRRGSPATSGSRSSATSSAGPAGSRRARRCWSRPCARRSPTAASRSTSSANEDLDALRRGIGQPRRAHQDRPAVRAALRRRDQQLPHRHGRGDRADRGARDRGGRRDGRGEPRLRPGRRGRGRPGERGGGGVREAEHVRFPHARRHADREQIEAIATRLYGAEGIDYLPQAEKDLARMEQLGIGTMPVCMAKTQLSLCHDPLLLNRPTGFILPVRGWCRAPAPASSSRSAATCSACPASARRRPS